MIGAIIGDLVGSRFEFNNIKTKNSKKINMNHLLDAALRIATQAHKGQTDKAGADYINHPIRVADRCATDEERIVALLHDTLEDTTVTTEQLLSEGFPSHLVEAIQSVTRNEGESYECFILRAQQNPIGRIVKLYDLEDNMNITRLPELTPKDMDRLNRYLRAYRCLTEEKAF